MTARDGTLRLVMQDVHGERLGEHVDIMLRHQVLSDQRLLKNVNAGKALVIEDLFSTPQGIYRIAVDPPSYLPVAQFVTIKAGSRTDLTLTFPIDPKKVKDVKFPPYTDLSDRAREILAASNGVISFEGRTGKELYDTVDPLRRAGFLNIVAKAGATVFGNGRSVLEYLRTLRELRGDRLFAAAAKELSAETQQGVAEGLFRVVDGSLHHPPPTFTAAGSFKTEDHYGNLQLTFFVCGDDCLVDIDIDDAAGLGHVFQVVRNELKDRATHPYDIREILIAFQGIDPGYRFEV